MSCKIILGVLCVAVGIGWALLREYWIYLPGIIVRLRDPIHPYRAVKWDTSLKPSDAQSDDLPPNVILIMVDDLGFNDISFFGGGVHGGNISTPNIDSIARNGVYFSQAYAGHATCAPSRAALMTGRYPSRVGYEFTPTHPLYAKILGTSPKAIRKGIYHKDLAAKLSTENMTLPRSEHTMADYFKKLDYRTIMLGKWHLGDGEGYKPIDRGFDETLGFNMISKYLPADDSRVVNYRLDDQLDKLLWANVGHYVSKDGGEKFSPGGFLTDYFAAEATRAIEANKHRPFFLYMAFTAPHTPLQALREDYDALSHIDDELTRVYGAIMISLDRAVGTILTALEDRKLSENTIVMFTNDNGAPPWVMREGSNSPFRGWKGTLFEGGLRVPMFMQWPRHIRAGSVVRDIVGHVDILPTLLAAASSSSGFVGERKKMMWEDSLLDGVNLMPFIAKAGSSLSADNVHIDTGAQAEMLRGVGNIESKSDAEEVPHKSLFWRSGHYKALRRGKWKLQVAERPPVQWMFDLEKDPYEMNNLALSPEHASLREELLAELMEVDAVQSEPLWASITETAVSIDKFFEYDEQEGDEYVYWPN